MIYILFFSFLILGALLSWKGKSPIYLACLMLFLFCIIGFRGLDVGPDTPGYVADFLSYSHLTYSEIIVAIKGSKEPLYVFITWFASCLSSDYIVFLLLWALFPCVALYTTLRDNLEQSREYVIAIVVFFLIGLFAFFVAGIRQTAALSILLYSYRYLKNIDLLHPSTLLKNKSTYLFVACFLCAYLIHNSSLLFIFALPLKYIRFRSWFVLLALGGYFLGQHVRLDFLTQLSSSLFDSRFSIYGNTYESSLSMSGYYMQLILFLLGFYKRKKLLEQDNENAFFLNMMMVGLIFQSMTGLIAEMYRVSFYCCIYSIVLIPRAVSCYDGNGKRNYVYPIVLFCSLFYLFFLSSANMPLYSTSINF